MKPVKRSMTGAAGMALAVAILFAFSVGDAGAAGTSRTKSKDKDKTVSKESTSGYMGVYMQELTDDMQKGLDLKVDKGVLVSGVADDSPADKAGLKDGDVILAFNGDAVASPDELRGLVRAAGAGSTAKLDVVRDGKKMTIDVTLGERPDDFRYSFHRMMDAPEVTHAFAMLGGPRLGIQAHEIDNEDMASYFHAKPGEGVLVLDVEKNSVADKAGVKAGDVVQAIGDSKIADVNDIRDACHDLDKGDEFKIAVLRHGKTETLNATMDDNAAWIFNSDDGDWRMWRQRAPRALDDSRDDIRRELNDLKREVKELKEKLEDHDG
jgi:serine protease Do